jgi:diacylglycerol kinase family enzyme
MLEKEASIDIVLTETAFPGHAMELMRDNAELLTYDAVICMGGDGVLHEMLQGCQARPDFQLLLRSLRLGVVGCGTGNGLAKSLTYAAEVSDAITVFIGVARVPLVNVPLRNDC